MTFLKQHNTLVTVLKFCAFALVLVVLAGCDFKVTAETEQQWQTNVQNCWPCVLYKSVFNATGQLIMLTYPFIARWALALLGVGILFWLAFKTGRMLTFLYEPDIKEYVHSVMIVLFKAMIVAAVLMTGDHFLCTLNMLVSPIIEIFAVVSRIVLTANSNISDGMSLPSDWVTNGLANMKYIEAGDGSCNLFSGNVAYQVQDVVYRVYVALNSGMSLGGYLIAESNMLNWIIGLFIMWMFFLMSLIFPWMFAESFLRLGAVLVLSPFVFVCWVFPSTKGTVRQAWNIAFGSMVQMLIACIYIGLLVGVILTFANKSFPGMLGGSRQTSDPGMVAQMKRLSTEAVSFFALIIIMTKMQANIPMISGYFGGDSQKSEVVAFFGGIKQLAISAVMIAVGAVMSAFGIPGGTNLMKAGAQRVADQAKDAATDAVHSAASSGEDTGGSSDAMGGSVGAGSIAQSVAAQKSKGSDGNNSNGGGSDNKGNKEDKPKKDPKPQEKK